MEAPPTLESLYMPHAQREALSPSCVNHRAIIPCHRRLSRRPGFGQCCLPFPPVLYNFFSSRGVELEFYLFLSDSFLSQTARGRQNI